MRRLLLVLVLLLAACTSTAEPSTTIVPAPTESPSSTVVAVPSTTTTTTVPEPTAEEVLLAEIDELISITEQLRELPFLAEPTITILTAEELSERVMADIDEELDPAEVARDTEALRILGVIPDGLDLATFYVSLLGEQVQGFYDSETKEMVIQATEGGLSEYEKMVIVHELVHALTDQHFDFGPVTDELYDAEEFDAAMAMRSLVEGDATLAESLYVQTLSQEQLLEIVATFGEVDSTVFDEAPYYIAESLIAPYVDGLAFVSAQFELAGWSGVDLAYEQVPTTTEQILHPEAYLDGEGAIEVALVGEPPEGYEVGEESTWGQSGLRDLLGAELLPFELVQAAEGWGGDRYRILWDGEDAIFQLQYVGDTPDDADHVAYGFREYLEVAAPEGIAWWILRKGDEVAVVVASDSAEATPLVKDLEALGFTG